MAVFKCKMCGGTIEFEQGATVGICDSCGTKQTLPRLDDDKKENLYDRANHFRRNNDFDKAMGIYEQILNEDNMDAEAYWSLVLCRYGIEYVEDPASHKRIPTVNRAQFTSIYMDEDYKSALQYADGSQKQLYEEEARVIDNIQKGILEISAKEEPFDVFISFKETGADGRRTRDAVLAHELYNELTKEGFKVFFAPVTLESKLGEAYEPYIFAALNSSKVMVVLGTKPENFNAVWVKNEWSRYLALIKNGARKTLIPAYKDMDPYDLPEEFSHLMAQDMSKLGFMQDLIRGIKKLAVKDEPVAAVKETVVVSAASNANTAPLLKRAFMFLEDGEWESADEYCEKVLDIDPECAEAYLGKLMSELRVRKQAGLKDCAQPFVGENNYAKVMRFGNEKLRSELEGYIRHINERNENARLTGIYNKALNNMNSANTEAAFKSAAVAFESIRGFKDADTLAKKCLEKAEISRKDAVYSSAISTIEATIDKKAAYESAIKIFKTISGWRDADEQIYACQRKIEEIKAKEEADRLEAERRAEEAKIAAEKAAKKRKKVISITAPIAAVIIIFLIILTKVIIPNNKYTAALELYNAGNYEEAITAFEALDGYKDSTEQIALCETGILDNQYTAALELYNAGSYEEAITAFEALDGYKDSADQLTKIKSDRDYMINCKAGDTLLLGSYEQDNDTSNGKEEIEWLVLAKEDNRILVISDKALDCQQYNTSYISVTWESCTLRKWLNGTFLDAAFSAEEQAMLQSTTVSADKNPKYDTDPGNATTDKVFLLSINEVNKYFSGDEARKCVPTEYAIAQGAYTSSSSTKGGAATCWWWLRSPGDDQLNAAGVYYDGSVFSFGNYVNIGLVCVRPALWINLES